MPVFIQQSLNKWEAYTVGGFRNEVKVSHKKNGTYPKERGGEAEHLNPGIDQLHLEKSHSGSHDPLSDRKTVFRYDGMAFNRGRSNKR